MNVFRIGSWFCESVCTFISLWRRRMGCYSDGELLSFFFCFDWHCTCCCACVYRKFFFQSYLFIANDLRDMKIKRERERVSKKNGVPCNGRIALVLVLVQNAKNGQYHIRSMWICCLCHAIWLQSLRVYAQMVDLWPCIASSKR